MDRKSPKVLAFVGMPGSGKSLCARYLQDKGYFQFRFGGIVTDEVERRGLAINPENERVVREELRETNMAAIAVLALPHLQSALEIYPRIVIDGLYSFSEYEFLKGEFGDELTVVCVACERELRYRRLANRDVRPLTRAEAEERDKAEIKKLEKGGPIAIADFTLLNNDSPEQLLDQVELLLKRLSFYS